MNNKFLYILFSLVLLFVKTNAQNYNVVSERTFEHLFLDHLETNANFHTGIKPYTKNEVDKVINYDSTLNKVNCNNKSVSGHLINNHLIDIKKNNFSFSLDPIVNTVLTIEKNNISSETINENSLGVNLKSSLGEKWSGQFVILFDNSIYPSYINNQVINKNIAPGYGYSENNKSIFSQGNITFTPNEVFAFQAGYGKNFIGDGYRSLFLSDNSNSYPYFKVSANIWKIKYIALYTNFQDIRFSNGNSSDYRQKFSAIHYLSFNATKWLNFGFFESIIFQEEEGNFYRGYDFSYLNPVIFLRSTEFAQGSADNALLGGNMKLKIKKKNIFYGQLIFDEFLFSELRDNNGFWGNKFGIQAGLKMYDFLTIKNLRAQIEYNIVRPFTYSHSFDNTFNTNSTLQNYGHFNASLAHPLGANFKETFLGLSFHKKRWIIEGLTTIAKVGFDTSLTFSIGQDIFRPNNNRADDFGNFTTQGLTTDIINTTLKISYLVNPKSHLMLQFGLTNRSFSNPTIDQSINLFFIGLKTSVINRYFDF